VSDDVLSLWALYGPNQREYPGRYVVRRWEVHPDGPRLTSDCFVEPTYFEARAHVPGGLVPIRRHPGDDPSVIESWL
jgi:hypothetical protein